MGCRQFHRAVHQHVTLSILVPRHILPYDSHARLAWVTFSTLEAAASEEKQVRQLARIASYPGRIDIVLIACESFKDLGCCYSWSFCVDSFHHAQYTEEVCLEVAHERNLFD